MEMDVSGVSRAHVGPSTEGKATLKPEAERPRCASTPCSPIRGTVAGYQILHMDSNYLVGFTTGEELLKLAHTWSDSPPDKGSVLEAFGRRRRRMPSSSETLLKSLGPGDTVRTLHTPLPLCLLKGKRAQSKSLDYLNLDKMTIKESTDTEVLQYQLQHLTLRGERVFSRNKT
uniref:Macrophage immunometabolism regulator n=1 Tax=Periophthalmus magnuspinnatus TaxID=409849 RepID=A0A3B4AG19_9GOBI